MHPRLRVVLVALLPTVLALTRIASAAEFSAHAVMRTVPDDRRSSATFTLTFNLHVKGHVIRTDATTGSDRQIIIMDAEKKKVWHLDPATKTYRLWPATPREVDTAMDALRGRLSPGQGLGKAQRVGSERVNGYQCDKLIAYGKDMKITVWYSRKLDFRVRSEAVHRPTGRFSTPFTSITELKDIRERKLPASMFRVPKSYRMVQSSPAGKGGDRRGQKSGAGADARRRGGR